MPDALAIKLDFDPAGGQPLQVKTGRNYTITVKKGNTLTLELPQSWRPQAGDDRFVLRAADGFERVLTVAKHALSRAGRLQLDFVDLPAGAAFTLIQGTRPDGLAVTVFEDLRLEQEDAGKTPQHDSAPGWGEPTARSAAACLEAARQHLLARIRKQGS